MSKSQNLRTAKRNRKDEFYTQLSDIEDELRHYSSHFRDKVVYCNCDDPRVSNFFQYFAMRFEGLGLKKLITTCYKNRSMDLFSQHDVEQAIRMEYEGDQDGNLRADPHEISVHSLQGDGDFRSPECIELLKRSDIVVTNPPFSLFREYIAQLIAYNKKFLILGSMNAITYKDVFPLIQGNKIWLGYHTGAREYRVPESYLGRIARIDDEGRRFVKMGNTVWFTNLEHNKRQKEMILYKSYTPEEYPKYDNYDAIEVGRVDEIPKNWGGRWVFLSPSWISITPISLKSLGWITM